MMNYISKEINTTDSSSTNENITQNTSCTSPNHCCGGASKVVDVEKNLVKEEPKVQSLNPNHLILGDWKGFVGNTLIKIRFEFTNQTNKILAWYIICSMGPIQPAGYSEGPETISTRVRYNYLTNNLLIEDLVCGPICGWVTSTSIIGNAPNGNVLLTR